VEPVRAALSRFWGDTDRRRALAVSLVAHLCALLLFVLWLSRPTPIPLEQFLVIDVGTPVQSEVPVEAPTVDDAAPASPVPQVADQETGEPQARTAERTETAAPDPQPRTQQPLPQPEQPRQPRAEERPAAQPAQQPAEQPAENARADDQPPVAPVPQVRQPAPQPAPTDLPLATTQAVLPEIDEVEVAPRPAEQAVEIPRPNPAALVPHSRTVAVRPSVEVAAPRDVPAPRPAAQVAAARAIPQPAATARVAAAQAVPTPGVNAAVAAPVPVPQPTVTSRVAAAQAVPLPGATARVAAARQIPLPGVQTQVAASRSVAVAAQVSVARPMTVPTPSIRAQVTAPVPEMGAAMAGAAPVGVAPAPSNRADDRPAGGNAARPGQDRAAEDARAGELGRAADTDEGEATGAQSLRPQVPYREERARPLAVLLDNARGYPQAGLTEASLIAEMPVEGGLTRLMAIFDQRDPTRLGPIRSARDYFVELARDYDGVLVHDGGSPAALAAIDRGALPSFNAYRMGDLFSRQQGRDAPYNLFSSGGSLREAVNRLRLDRSLERRGIVPRPPDEAPNAASVEVSFGGNYRSGFSYIRELDIYRWRRNGENAVDYQGEAVFVEAVLIARIDVRPIPDDPAGRLYIPLRGGEATLYLRGKAIDGRWLPAQSEGQGVAFIGADGEPVDLTPFRMWLLFAPGYARVASN
jgi:hypothetical protein